MRKSFPSELRSLVELTLKTSKMHLPNLAPPQLVHLKLIAISLHEYAGQWAYSKAHAVKLNTQWHIGCLD
jgi:hypothetical protein